MGRDHGIPWVPLFTNNFRIELISVLGQITRYLFWLSILAFRGYTTWREWCGETPVIKIKINFTKNKSNLHLIHLGEFFWRSGRCHFGAKNCAAHPLSAIQICAWCRLVYSRLSWKTNYGYLVKSHYLINEFIFQVQYLVPHSIVSASY